ncbi:cyclophilin-like protein [Trichodelitschia bisporula]|uniref:Cyclophilin-like protein n=1 Tax=Trichodelitschia bisporula TaxID=703511 RepID=A0A6G1I8X9_9PEZI|nr:cyclophilin-like protein [Trichodelitschia bisporula]
MSTKYNLEPQPTAKVLLQTTGGDLSIELFAKQTPVTSRNFLQLCLDGYYDGTIFHRLVPGFVLQGGDPTGTGSGGESSYDGEPFADEFHSRLKFNRRGLLGMANSGKKDDNGSQFFFTLGETPELIGKNTMFGRIEGDTIYNLMKMAEGELAQEGGDRPLYPYKITGTEILVNPFDDMVKRMQRAQPTAPEKKEVKKPKRKAGKALLSFAGDDGDEEVAPTMKKPKFNPKLVSAGFEDGDVLNNPPMPKAPPRDARPVLEARSTLSVRPSPTEPKSQSPPPPTRKPKQKAPSPARESKRRSLSSAPKPKQRSPSPSDSGSDSDASSAESPEASKVSDLVSRTNAQIAELKASMRRTGLAVAAPAASKKTALEALIPETSTRGRKRGAVSSKEKRQTLDMFKAFKEKLETIPAEEPLAENGSEPVAPTDEPHAAAEVDGEEEALCDLHFIVNCQSCTKWDKAAGGDEDNEDFGPAWMAHRLNFDKDRLGKDLEWRRKNQDELVVIDPREKARELGVEKGPRKEDRDRNKGGKAAVRGRR